MHIPYLIFSESFSHMVLINIHIKEHAVISSFTLNWFQLNVWELPWTKMD